MPTDVSAIKKRLRVIAPAATIVVAIVTLVTCVLIAKACGIYLSGLTWPYFSDTGRDAPAYYVFCVGLTIGAVLIAICWDCNHEFQLIALCQSYPSGGIPKLWSALATICRVTGMASSIGLPTLSIFDVSSHLTVHLIGAYWFFALECLTICLNTIVSRKIYSLTRSKASGGGYAHIDSPSPLLSSANTTIVKRRRTVVAQFLLCVVFFVAFTIYIPVGSAISTCDRLSVAACLEKDLGTHYCTTKMRLDANFTTLYTCEANFANAQMSAVGQLFSVLSLIGYTMTFLFHDYSIKTHDVGVLSTPIIHVEAAK